MVSRKARAGVGVGEGAMGSGGHAGRHEQILHPRLRPLESGAVRTGTEHQSPVGRRRSANPATSGASGPIT